MKLRNSTDEPMHVSFLHQSDHGLPGRIGVTFAPGRKDRDHGWDRDLVLDLLRLRDHFGVATLVSLLEPHERVLLQIPDLVERARALGMETIGFPIRDFSVPTSLASARTLVASILEAAAQSRTVVIHCRGGIGRSGMVAAACLVARGIAPETAIECVRRVRPGALETPEQEKWIGDFLPSSGERRDGGAA